MQRALLKAAQDIEKCYKSFDQKAQKVATETEPEKATKIRVTCRSNRVKARSLVVTTKVLSPYVKNTESVEQLNDFMKAFSKDVIGLRDICEVNNNNNLQPEDPKKSQRHSHIIYVMCKTFY